MNILDPEDSGPGRYPVIYCKNSSVYYELAVWSSHVRHGALIIRIDEYGNMFAATSPFSVKLTENE